jgi:phage pi2 protein 07
MYRVSNILIILFIIVFFISGCAETAIQTKADPNSVAEQIAKFAPVIIQYDHNLLDENETKALKEIVEASRFMDDIFLNQVYGQNEAIQKQLLVLSDISYRTLFNIMFGPFDLLEEDMPFINSTTKPLGANYYPEDMSKEEFNRWIDEHPEDKDSFENEFTVIRHKDRRLVAVPNGGTLRLLRKKVSCNRYRS